MPHGSRFESASSLLALRVLLMRSGRALWICLALGVWIHFSLMATAGSEAEHKMARPLTTQFVKRQPRLTKPLELQKRPRPRRRQVQREMVSVKARTYRTQYRGRFELAQTLAALTKPEASIGRMRDLTAAGLDLPAVAGMVGGSRDPEHKIDMSLELLDIGDLDTGQYHALVIQDPYDKRSIRGFCHLAMAQVAGAHDRSVFEIGVAPGFLRVAAAMNEYTDIRTDILGRLTLNDEEIFKAPWFFINALLSFTLSNSELCNLGRYMMSGGFVFSDSNHHGMNTAYTGGVRALRQALLDALGTQGVEVTLEKLPNGHPIYGCYFDFDGPPVAGDGSNRRTHPDRPEIIIIGYLEGIEVDGRLVAIFSLKAYAAAWTYWGRRGSAQDPSRALQFAVNTIVFALTQEGSITHRLMESVK